MQYKLLLYIYFLLLVCYSGAAISNDNIAFLAIHKDYWQVWLMDKHGANAYPVTDSKYDKSRISWYPDYNNLLISGNQGELVRLSLNDKKETDISIPFKGVNDAVISPNGNYIAFSHIPKGSMNNKLWLMDIASGNKVSIGRSKGIQHEPVFSLDSQVLYYLSGDGGQSHDIMQYTIQSKSTKPLTAAALYNLDVAPYKSNKFAFSSNRSGNYEIWLLDGNTVKKLTDNPALDGRPTWSSDGNTIYFESNRDSVMNIWSIDVHGKQKAKQITFHKEGARYPLWREQW